MRIRDGTYTIGAGGESEGAGAAVGIPAVAGVGSAGANGAVGAAALDARGGGAGADDIVLPS
jgi:hypothetical protein